MSTAQVEHRSRQRHKPALRSRTITGALAIIVCNLALLLGWTLDRGMAAETIGAIMNLILAGYTIWGRVKARSKISGILTLE